jgi:hypothetical protein
MLKLNNQEKQYLLNDLVEYRERAIELLGDENPKDKFNNIIGYKKQIRLYSSIIEKLKKKGKVNV